MFWLVRSTQSGGADEAVLRLDVGFLGRRAPAGREEHEEGKERHADRRGDQRDWTPGRRLGLGPRRRGRGARLRGRWTRKGWRPLRCGRAGPLRGRGRRKARVRRPDGRSRGRERGGGGDPRDRDGRRAHPGEDDATPLAFGPAGGLLVLATRTLHADKVAPAGRRCKGDHAGEAGRLTAGPRGTPPGRPDRPHPRTRTRSTNRRRGESPWTPGRASRTSRPGEGRRAARPGAGSRRGAAMRVRSRASGRSAREARWRRRTGAGRTPGRSTTGVARARGAGPGPASSDRTWAGRVRHTVRPSRRASSAPVDRRWLRAGGGASRRRGRGTARSAGPGSPPAPARVAGSSSRDSGNEEPAAVSVARPEQVSAPPAIRQSATSPRLVSGYFWSKTWLPSEKKTGRPSTHSAAWTTCG